MCDASYFIQGYLIVFFTGHIVTISWKNLPFLKWKEKYFTFCRNTEHCLAITALCILGSMKGPSDS